MLVHTTLNVRWDILKSIRKTAETLGLPQNTVMVMLLKRMLAHHREMQLRIGRAVQYQDAAASEEWVIVHVFYRGEEYEQFNCMRLLFKYSVSFLLAYAVLNYMDELLTGKDATPNCDNYNYEGYDVAKNELETGVCYSLYWLKTMRN